MSLFKQFETKEDIQQDKDTLGGGSKFSPWESDLYDLTISLAYVDESESGAMNVNFTFSSPEGKDLNQTIYITSGKDKGGKNYYTDKEGNKKYLPGFNVVNDICMLAIGEPLSDLETETKVLSIYNFDQRKEVPTKKEVIVDLLGKDISLGVLKIIKDKYNKPGETQTINEISKVFRTSDKMTVNEVKAESPAEFHKAWVEKNKGITVNKVGKDSKAAKPATATNVPTDTAKPKKSLFDKS